MTDQPFVTVFTITYNQRRHVLELIQDLALQDYPSQRFELVVLDDGGTDGTTEAVQDTRRDVRFGVKPLRRKHEAHYLNAKRWNECIAAATSEHDILIQVDDVRLRTDFVSRHVAWHLAPARPRVVTGSKFEGDQITWDLASCRRSHLAREGGRPREGVPWTAVWGASLSYTRQLVGELWHEPHDRPFDERMTGWGYHEVEFACRAAQAGATLIYDPGVGVFHRNHSPATDRGRGLDHGRQRALGTPRNEEYVRTKHRLAELPHW